MLQKLIQGDRRVRYGLLVVLVVALFLVGQRLGSMVSNLFVAKPDPPAEIANSGGMAIVNPPTKLQDFTLTDQHNESVQISSLQGKTLMMFFGYTHCPDECPTTLNDFTRVKEALGTDSDKVEFVFISVDGGRDVPEVMATYLSNFDDSFIGLTGASDIVARAGTQFGLYFDATTVDEGYGHAESTEHDDGDEHYFVEHTSPAFLIDENGYLRNVFFYRTNIDTMVDGVRSVIANPAS